MDRLHCTLFEALEKLSGIEDFQFANAFRDFVAVLEQSFRLEEAWMEKTQYPLVLMHLEEHARALSGLHHVHSRIMAGEISEGREVVQNVLPHWLAFHMANMPPTLKRRLDQADPDTDTDPRSLFTEELAAQVSH